MLLEKLTIKDTFKQWRDKINAIINAYSYIPSTNESGLFVINQETTLADDMEVDLPTIFKDKVTFNQSVTITGKLDAVAESAERLKNTISINDTAFDGSSSIDTIKWGASRSIRISDYLGNNVGDPIVINGSQDYIIKLPKNLTVESLEGVSIDKFSNPRNLSGIKFNGENDVIRFAVCTSSSTAKTKIVLIYDYEQVNGAYIFVLFENINLAQSPTLQINDETARPIMINGASVGQGELLNNVVYTLVYYNNAYHVVGSSDTNVLQKQSTDNAEYPLLASPSIEYVESKTTNSVYTSGITINPSTNSLSVNGIVTADNGLIANVGYNAITINDLVEDISAVAGEDTIKYFTNLKDKNKKILCSQGFERQIDNSVYQIFTVPRYLSSTQAEYSTLKFGWKKGETPEIYTNCNITSAGTITAKQIYNAVWNDYAEFFPKGEETEPGDIIALDVSSKEEKYIKATDKSKLVVGIHSDTYGHILGGDDSIEESEKTHIPVGLSGRVYVKFKGTSILGEGVVPSDTPGVGRLYDESLDDKRKIVGYIVYDPEPSSQNERKVRVLINR